MADWIAFDIEQADRRIAWLENALTRLDDSLSD